MSKRRPGRAAVAVPDLRPEAPDPAEQQDDGQRREQEPATGTRRIRLRVEQAEGAEPLEISLVSRPGRADDHLALATMRTDRLRRAAASSRARSVAAGHRSSWRRSAVTGSRRQAPAGRREALSETPEASGSPDVGQERVAHLLALRASSTRPSRAQCRPAGRVESLQRGDRRGRQAIAAVASAAERASSERTAANAPSTGRHCRGR